jgi:hypothetical protein
MASSAVKWVTGQCVGLLGRPVAQRWICASMICMVCGLSGGAGGQYFPPIELYLRHAVNVVSERQIIA